ncbi:MULTISPECIES: hypothetical protein [unclassified Rhizobium]|uniref:hypothetical protein n=1 Tax=unclassified Rhizobium TaxID=2613769 RepID=UPI000A46C5E9|nr:MULTISPECIES: hypothetical protein [unclassified Rhizobium]
MATANLVLSFDTLRGRRILSALAELSERFPQFGERFLSLIDSGDELFRLDFDRCAASLADKALVRLYPSDALSRLMTAFGAGDVDQFVFKHVESPVALVQNITTNEVAQ